MGASSAGSTRLAWLRVLQVELTSQESGKGSDASEGTTQGHFVVHSVCQASHEDAKCHTGPEKQKVFGGQGSPPPTPAHMPQHKSYNVYMMISYADISGHQNAHSLTPHPRTVAHSLADV